MEAFFDDGSSMEVSFGRNHILLNGIQEEIDVQPLPGSRFHILRKGRSYTAELIEAGDSNNRVILRLRGREYAITLKDEGRLLMESLGYRSQSKAAIQSVPAPMPGLIVEILAQEGQEIKQGDPVVVLQAMKMENLIKSPVNGIVRSVPVKKGQNVEKGDYLMHFY